MVSSINCSKGEYMKSTPTPWIFNGVRILGPNGENVEANEVNGPLVVHAVNAHTELVEALLIIEEKVKDTFDTNSFLHPTVAQYLTDILVTAHKAIENTEGR